MTTEARILANRLNAQKSTGPKTPQGKAVVSQNALKHGLSPRHDVIITESQADFDRHRDSLLDELDPQGPMESILTDRIVSLSWRLKRTDLIQNQTFDAMNEKNTTNPLAKLAKSFGLKGLALPQAQISDLNPDLTLGRIALKDFANARVLDRLLMYERRIEHSLYKTTLELQRLTLLRNLEPPIPHSQNNLAPGFTGGSPQKSSENQPSSAPPFSRRRHDDALTPNSNPRTKQSCNELQIPTHHESIQNRESSIKNLEAKSKPQVRRAESPPEAERDPQGAQVPARRGRPDCAKQTQFPKTQNQRNRLCHKNLRKKPPQPHAKKQTQTNPIPPLPKPPLLPKFRTHFPRRNTAPVPMPFIEIRNTNSKQLHCTTAADRP